MTCQILVVDDERDVETLLSQKFRKEIRENKYAFSFAYDGAEAYQKVIETAETPEAIDMVLTDINMPVMGGLELLGKLNDLVQPPKTVVVSAYSDMTNIRTAMNKGAFDFLTKPINFQDLAITLERTLEAVAASKFQQSQLQQSQMLLVQNEKMSLLGQMLAGIAHEIKNPVNFIVANLEPAKDYIHDLMRLLALYQTHTPEPDPAISACIEEIDLAFLKTDLPRLFASLEMGTVLIQELALSLRTFSRTDEIEKQTVNLHQGIKSTLVILNNRLKANATRPEIKVTRAYGELPEVSCYPSQINQVVMNLLANAIEAFDQANEGLTYDEIEADPNTIKIITGPADEGWVKIVVVDNGPGMDEATRAQLFEPFFTTKPVGKGTGLGLAISRQIIVEKHGGKLSCQSVLGQGTQFVIELPCD